MSLSNYHRDSRGKCLKCKCSLTFAKEHVCPTTTARPGPLPLSPSEARERVRARLCNMLLHPDIGEQSQRARLRGILAADAFGT